MSSETEIGQCLADLLGPEGVGGKVAIPGPPPVAVCSPADEDAVAAVVRLAGERGLPIYPYGLGLRQSWGLPIDKPGIVVKTDRLDGVVEYNPDDLTISVEAGMTLTGLAELTQAHNQRLALDPAGPDRTSIGGLLATGVSGPRRFGHGSVRDAVLGIRYVDAEGRKIKAGGKVVKNVAGYDVCRLMTGSFGTLGIITSASLILRPVPASTRLAILGFGDEAASESALAAIMDGPTRPVILELLNESAAAGIDLAGGQFVLIVGFEDVAASTAWQVERIVELSGKNGWTCRAVEEGESLEICGRLRDWPLGRAEVGFKVSVLPAKVAEFFGQVRRWADLSGTRIGLASQAGNGVIWGTVEGLGSDAAKAKALLESLREAAVAGCGNMIVTEVGAGLGNGLARWGRGRPDWETMGKIKRALDPGGILNPGRFIDGP